MEYPIRSVRLDDEVWEAVKKLPKSLNKFLREVLSAGGVFEPDVYSPETEAKIATNVRPRRQSKKDRIVAELAASDLTAQSVGRDDIEYGSHEVAPRGQHVANLDATGPRVSDGRGKATVQTWRQGRAPLPKPKDRK